MTNTYIVARNGEHLAEFETEAEAVARRRKEWSREDRLVELGWITEASPIEIIVMEAQ